MQLHILKLSVVVPGELNFASINHWDLPSVQKFQRDHYSYGLNEPLLLKATSPIQFVGSKQWKVRSVHTLPSLCPSRSMPESLKRKVQQAFREERVLKIIYGSFEFIPILITLAKEEFVQNSPWSLDFAK